MTSLPSRTAPTSVRRMASIYPRGTRLWGRLKDERGKWVCKATDYVVGQEAEARREIAAAQRILDRKRAVLGDGAATVESYCTGWLERRKLRNLVSYVDDVGRLTNHVLPRVGATRLDELRPHHIRDLVRALVATGMAARTVRNTYGILRTMLRDAYVDEVIPSNPCVLHRGELPGKEDKDPEWRSQATYTRQEVGLLVTSQNVPHKRRVQYALKSLAGLRHGEVAGLRWRHWDETAKPLTRLNVSTSYDRGRTKTGRPREIPVHSALAKMLRAWRVDWLREYGREPGPDDYVVPTWQMNPIDAADAGHAFVYDLVQLGLRVKAGQKRNRGGHDLRAWFITTAQEDGAHRDLLRVVTHPGKGDVVGGYTRPPWKALCAEVAKLRAPKGIT